MSGEEAPGGNDYLAFSSNDRTPHQNANQFRPYKNNQWRNSSHNRGNFSPQGFSSPITGSDGFRGGNRGGGRPRFNQDNRYGNSHDGDSNSIGRNRLPRSFGNQRPYHNRRGGNGGEQKQRSFQKINFQPAGDSGVCMRALREFSDCTKRFACLS